MTLMYFRQAIGDTLGLLDQKDKIYEEHKCLDSESLHSFSGVAAGLRTPESLI